MREKLVNVGSVLTLEKAQEIARLYEMFTTQTKTMLYASGEDSKVNFITKSLKHYDEKQTKRKPNFGKRKQKEQGVIIRNLVHAVDTNMEVEKTHVQL